MSLGYPSPDLVSQRRLSKHSVMTDTDSSDDSQKLHKPWLDSFMEQPCSDWFCYVPASFTSDGFNTSGLSIDKLHAKTAFNQLLDITDENSSSESFDSDSEDEIEKATEVLFGLIHSRYIFTTEGLREMRKKYEAGVFGVCPRTQCKDHFLLPIGLTDHPGINTVKRYCPSCNQIYKSDELHKHLDGAYFTKSFPHYLLLEIKRIKKKGIDRLQSGDISYPNTATCTSESVFK